MISLCFILLNLGLLALCLSQQRQYYALAKSYHPFAHYVGAKFNQGKRWGFIGAGYSLLIIASLLLVQQFGLAIGLVYLAALLTPAAALVAMSSSYQRYRFITICLILAGLLALGNL
ncbi:MAG: DUF3325 family protein [Cellvibrionaceae bacterium]|nr:DUF3325 family protein [Cellvibrionaceae bacterium]